MISRYHKNKIYDNLDDESPVWRTESSRKRIMSSHQYLFKELALFVFIKD